MGVPKVSGPFYKSLYDDDHGGFQQLGVPDFGVSILRIIVYWENIIA